MSTHPSVSDLEALIAGTLDEDRSIMISAHADDCAVCGRELAWLRAERDLFAQRARGVPPSEVWAQIESQIAARLREHDTAPRGLRRVLARAFRSDRIQWFAVAGAAVAVVGMIGISPLSPLRRTEPAPSATQPLGAPAEAPQPGLPGPASPDGAHGEDVVRSRAAVSGPIALELSTLAAEVEVAAGGKDEATLTLSDGETSTVRWLPPTAPATAWRLDFGGGSALRDGHLRLLLPEGSRVAVRTTSGDVHVAGLKGDVSVHTASGEISIQDAKDVTLVAVSGDVDVSGATGNIDVKTTSGELKIQGDIAQALRFSTVSGDLTLHGACRVAACKISVETVSGGVSLARRAEQALNIRLRSHSGEIAGADGLPIEMRRVPGQVTEWSTRLGAGTGTLDVSTQSGDVHLDVP